MESVAGLPGPACVPFSAWQPGSSYSFFPRLHASQTNASQITGIGVGLVTSEAVIGCEHQSVKGRLGALETAC